MTAPHFSPQGLTFALSLCLVLVSDAAAWAQPEEDASAGGSADTGYAPEDDEGWIRSETVAPAPRLVPAQLSSGAVDVLLFPDEAATATTTSDHLRRLPVLTTTRTGSPGAPTWVSMRGASTQQTQILLDGTPLHDAGAAGFDLSLIPASWLQGALLYRSGAPFALGPPLPGGAIDLRLRDAPSSETHLQLSTGSLGTTRGSLSAARATASTSVLVTAGGGLASGRFPYYDDGGTPFDRGDDRTSVRQNNDLADLHLLLRLARRWDAWESSLAFLSLARAHGLAGYGTLTTERARADQRFARLIGQAAGYRLLGGVLDLRLTGVAGAHRLAFRDPLAELSPVDRRWRAWRSDGLVRVQPTWFIGSWLVVEQAVETSVEHHQGEDADISVEATRRRVGLSTEAHARAPAGLRPEAGIRYDDVRSTTSDAASHEGLLSPRAGLTWSMRIDDEHRLELFGRLQLLRRVASFDELFGDGAWRIGTPSLAPEARSQREAGALLRGDRGALGYQVRGAIWLARVDNLIVWTNNAQGIARSQNIGRAALLGQEVDLELRWARPWTVDLAWARLDTRNRTREESLYQARLPGRPLDRGYVGVSWQGEHARARIGWFAVSSLFIDDTNSRRVPPRHDLDASLGLHPTSWRGLSLHLDAQNLLDQRTMDVPLRDGGDTRRVPQAVADVMGYPLPGRLLFVTLRYAHAAP